MRLPRRVPWASPLELDQLCNWIYADETDIDAKLLALQRLSAWKSMTTLPHALESTLGILTAVVQDSGSQTSTSCLHIRQSYASAIIRLVNGLVDPLQLGAYARSIASIAVQLNLPAWLVEVRHAATHEDLPSIEVLRQAARDALGWLLQNYFLPTVNPSLPSVMQAAPLRSISPLLREYKALLKTITRDASLRSQYQADVTKVLRDIERWIAEAKVAADISAAMLDWDNEDDDSEREDSGRERWALQRLCEALMEPGGLVPVSKKKRAVVTSSFLPPSAVTAIWAPLLDHICSLHPNLPSVLATKIVCHLTLSAEPVEKSDETISIDVVKLDSDNSYDMCIASWVNWLVRQFAGQDDSDVERDGALNPTLLATSIAINVGPQSPASHDGAAARILLDRLCSRYPYMNGLPSLLTLRYASSPSTWNIADLNAMDQRLALLNAHLQPQEEQQSEEGVADQYAKTDAGPQLPRGWRQLSLKDGWKPAPIGMQL